MLNIIKKENYIGEWKKLHWWMKPLVIQIHPSFSKFDLFEGWGWISFLLLFFFVVPFLIVVCYCFGILRHHTLNWTVWIFSHAFFCGPHGILVRTTSFSIFSIKKGWCWQCLLSWRILCLCIKVQINISRINLTTGMLITFLGHITRLIYDNIRFLLDNGIRSLH